jgi:hypothetical protein
MNGGKRVWACRRVGERQTVNGERQTVNGER